MEDDIVLKDKEEFLKRPFSRPQTGFQQEEAMAFDMRKLTIQKNISSLKFQVKSVNRIQPKGFRDLRELDRYLLKLRVQTEDPFIQVVRFRLLIYRRIHIKSSSKISGINILALTQGTSAEEMHRFKMREETHCDCK